MRLANTRPVPLFKFSLIFMLCSMVVMTLHMNAFECVSLSEAHMVGLSSQELNS